jgi:hypothetical protein
MSQRKWLLLMSLAIVFSSLAGFLGASLARTSSASASTAPLAKQITRTFTIKTGFACNYPYPDPIVAGDYPIANYSDQYCVINATHLSSQPVSMACIWTPGISGTPWSGAWRNCYESYVEPISAGLDVIWNSQQNQLELLYSGGSAATPYDILIVYSAVL